MDIPRLPCVWEGVEMGLGLGMGLGWDGTGFWEMGIF